MYLCMEVCFTSSYDVGIKNGLLNRNILLKYNTEFELCCHRCVINSIIKLICHLSLFHVKFQIQAIQLDDIMQQPEDPKEEHIFYYRTKSQRDTIQILKSSQLQDAFSYIEDHSHPELWRILAEHALEKLDLSIAEKVITSFLFVIEGFYISPILMHPL